MLTLTISHDGHLPPLPRVTDPRVTHWRDNDGAVCAYGESADGSHWLHLPSLASFRFDGQSTTITAFPRPGARIDLVQDAFARSVLPMALQARGGEALHASAVLLAGGVVALCAVSETGKSTLAYALGRRGHPIWADDAVVFQSHDTGVTALPVPFSVRIRPASASYFGARSEAAGVTLVSPDECQPTPIIAVCVLRRAEHTVSTVRLTPVDAFAAVLEHAYCFDLHDAERKRRMINAYAALTRQVPAIQVEFADGLDQIPTIAEAIERAVLESVPGGSGRVETARAGRQR